ncbi:MAG: protein kinase, partial [Acidobacteria bacterium]|nr:protein kinase [Acidobacteriota bacterium]
MIERKVLNALLRRGEVSPEQIRQAILSADADPDDPASDDRLLALLEETDIVPTQKEKRTSDDQLTATLRRSVSGGDSSVAENPASPLPVFGADSAFSRRYEIMKILGRGGMGIVYLAYDRLLKRDVAVKIIQDPDEKERRIFLREASAQARVSHENVCRVYDAGELNGQLFIAMQYVRGKNLRLATTGLPLAEKI